MLTRREFLAATSALTLGACTVTENGNVTTVTLNVAQVDAYAKVAASGVTTVLSIAAVASVIGAPAVAIINTAVAALTAAIAQFDTASGGSVNVTYDSTSVKTAFDTVLADFGTVLTDVQNSVSSLSGKIGTADLANVTTAVSAMQTGLNLLKALVATVSAPAPAMTETQMFSAVHMTVVKTW